MDRQKVIANINTDMPTLIAPSDELNDLFDFEAGRTYVKLQFMISYFINTAAGKPVWNEGDFFERFVVKD